MVSRSEGAGGRGAGRVSAANWGIFGGGGLNIFFRPRNVHQVDPNLSKGSPQKGGERVWVHA